MFKYGATLLLPFSSTLFFHVTINRHPLSKPLQSA